MIYNRIPGYIKGCKLSFFGYVMRDISNRFLLIQKKHRQYMNNLSINYESESESELHEDEIFVPPSILSFYADIPKEHKLKLTQRIPESNTTKRTVVIKGCQCATKMVTWFICDEHPWDITTLREFDFREAFVLVDCSDKPTHLEIRVVRNEEPIKRSVKMRKQSGMAHLNNVNIMFLELGSVSLQYTDRHLPKTRELLKRYRINRNDGNEFECPYNVCSAEFSFTSLVGANSIPNQVAALNGCINSPADELCGIVNTSVGDICNDIKMLHHGLST